MHAFATGTATPAHARVALFALSTHFKHSAPHQEPQKHDHLQWSAPYFAVSRKHRAHLSLTPVLAVMQEVNVELSRPSNRLKLLLPHSEMSLGKLPSVLPPPSLVIKISSS
mmetsp:Transcript_147988/g.210138  ORF Transcript_147988/g.210138 Transcript_147988/m.210138 type:complete len:111 (+) Transcript_147988:318-650(+)